MKKISFMLAKIAVVITLALCGLISNVSAADCFYECEIIDTLQEFEIDNYEFLIGGSSELETYQNFSSYGTQNFEQIQIRGEEFVHGFNIEVPTNYPNEWDSAMNCEIPKDVAKGDTIWLRYYVKSATADFAQLRATITQLPDYGTDVFGWSGNAIATDDGFTQIDLYGKCLKDATANDSQSKLRLDFSFAYKIQSMQIGGISVVNLHNISETQLNQLVEKNAQAKYDEEFNQTVDQRIEENRKGDLEIEVIDQDGNAVQTADITVNMTKHAYDFGSAIGAADLMTKPKAIEVYKDMFNTATLVNDMKWEAWSGEWGSYFNQQQTKNAVDLFVENDIKVNGHVLIWPSFRNTPSFLQGYENNPTELKAQINTHIEDMVQTFDGKIDCWDVLNEPFDNNDITKILDADGVNDPRSLIEWFDTASNSSANEMTLVYNDFGLWGNSGNKHYNYMKFMAEYLANNNSKMNLIGAQAYFQPNTLLSMKEIDRRIDDLYASGNTKIKVSEYNFKWNGSDDEHIDKVKYNYTRDFMKTVFSNPNTTGFIAWDTFEYDSVPEYTGYFKSDYSLTPMGEAAYDLIKGEWWSNEEGSLVDSLFKTRVFLGDYEVTVTVDGEQYKYNISVDKNNAANKFVLDLSKAGEIPTTPDIPQEEVILGDDRTAVVPTLLYHFFTNNLSEVTDYTITADMFDADMKYLSDNGYTAVSSEQVINFVERGVALPEKPVLITIDDGFDNAYRIAYPILEKYNMKATLSITRNILNETGWIPEPDFLWAGLNWSMIKEMTASGVIELGNHTTALHSAEADSRYGVMPLPGESLADYTRALNDDISSLQQKILDETGKTVQVFTYPYGAFNNDTKKIIADMGFKMTFGTSGVVNTFNKNISTLDTIGRIARTPALPTQAFFESFNIR